MRRLDILTWSVLGLVVGCGGSSTYEGNMGGARASSTGGTTTTGTSLSSGGLQGTLTGGSLGTGGTQPAAGNGATGGGQPTGGSPSILTGNSSGGFTWATGGLATQGGATGAATGGTLATQVTASSTLAQGGALATGGSRASGGTNAVGGIDSAGGTTATGSGSNQGGLAASGGTIGTGSSSPSLTDYCGGIIAGKNCDVTTLQADVNAVNMLLVIDQSGSMLDAPTSTDTVSKWEQTRQALAATLSDPLVFNNIKFGLELFPSSGDPKSPGVDGLSIDPAVSCNIPTDGAAILVDVAQGQQNVNQIFDVLSITTPAGGTPTAAALSQAYDYFTQGKGRDLPGSKWVLLATDGGPNCNPALACDASTCTQNLDCKCATGCNSALNCCASTASNSYGFLCLDDAATISAIARLAVAGIKTFVVGIPGSEVYASALNSMAMAGGMPNPKRTNGRAYYAVSSGTALVDLKQAFGSITGLLAPSCDIPLSFAQPGTSNKVSVVVDCTLQTLVPTDTATDAGVSGFYLDSTTSPAHVRFTGAACDDLLTPRAHNVDIIFGCDS